MVLATFHQCRRPKEMMAVFAALAENVEVAVVVALVVLVSQASLLRLVAVTVVLERQAVLPAVACITPVEELVVLLTAKHRLAVVMAVAAMQQAPTVLLVRLILAAVVLVDIEVLMLPEGLILLMMAGLVALDDGSVDPDAAKEPYQKADPEPFDAPAMRDRLKAAIGKASSATALDSLWKHPKACEAFDKLHPAMQAELTAAYTERTAQLQDAA